MEKIDVGVLIETQTDERVHGWKLDDGRYYIATIEENGDEYTIGYFKDSADVFQALSDHGLI